MMLHRVAAVAVGAVAVVVATWVYLGHRADDAERAHEAQAMKAAAEWSNLLINMTKDNVAVNVPKLHEGTVGQLNVDFEASVKPYRDVIQTLQSRTSGRVARWARGLNSSTARSPASMSTPARA